MSPIRRFPHLLSAAVLCACCAGCASDRPVDGSGLARAIRDRGLDPATVVVPFTMNDEMRTWAHRLVPKGTPVEDRLQRLLQGLLDPAQLRIEYEARYTGTAEEVFQSRHANCLAFTSLFVGMAREVGVPVFFLDIGDVEKFEKEGDLVVVSGHISAGYGGGREMKILDFSPNGDPAYRRVRPISDLTAVALFHSNRGAELLRAGKQEEALGWLQKAVALDPDLGRIWVNYGVALRRVGRPEEAEAAYRRALEVDPETLSAYQDLAALLRSRGREQEGGELLAVAARLGSRNPFNYLALGDISLAHARYDEARRFYRKALRLSHDSAEPYAAMGMVALATGDNADAQKWLRKAAAIDGQNVRVKQLLGRLGGGERPAGSGATGGGAQEG
jgi:tetratricopeptide (TPR) repeat protein